jgi:hypothetical protein
LFLAGELVSISNVKAIKIKEGTLGDLSSIGLNLPESNSGNPKQSRSTKMTRKNRQRITNVEIAQFQAVLAHPSFQANPMATIHDHLENTIKAATRA